MEADWKCSAFKSGSAGRGDADSRRDEGVIDKVEWSTSAGNIAPYL